MVLEGLLTAVGGFTGNAATASMEVLKDGVWLHRNDGWLPVPRNALTCAVLPLAGLEEHLQHEDTSVMTELEEGIFGLDLEDSEESDTSEEEEEEMGGDSLIEDSEDSEEE